MMKFQIIVFYISEEFVFTLTNGAGPGEMPPYAAFHLGLHRLPKYPLMVLGPDYNASLTLSKTSVKY